MTARRSTSCLALLGISLVILAAGEPARSAVDRSPGATEYGYRPAEGEVCLLTPPPFVWVRQRGAVRYELQVAGDRTFPEEETTTFRGIVYNLYTPAAVLPSGRYWWRYRFVREDGSASEWSRCRGFVIDRTAKPFPFITPELCRRRIPSRHPRLMLRPEDVPPLRRRILREPLLRDVFDELRRQADTYLTKPLIPEPTVMARAHDPKTRQHWWPNRTTTIEALSVADTLAFVHLITREDRYGQAARRWILHTAGWSPSGPTNLILNDEAAMPFLYLLPRAYDWAYDALSDADREKVRRVMRVRCRTARAWLEGTQHMNCPFESHNNRLWHWLGESAICFYDELDEAPVWLDYALNYFFAIYPVWGGRDGGWHEGANYWNSYVYRSLYWMDVARSALQIEPLTKPYYQRVGDYALYVAPPHAPVGGFGDLSYSPPGGDWRYAMEYFARRIRNPYWQWWAEQKGGGHERGIYGLLRLASSKPIAATPPDDLRRSKAFRGVGVAALHETLLDARQDVTFLLKSSPYGRQSHGHNPQNTFVLCAYGDELLSTCVYRDEHFSNWHKNWAWSTRAHNALLVDHQDQPKNTPSARGRIVAFKTTTRGDYVAGDATEAYPNVERFVRHVVFAKPDVIVILDDVRARRPATYQWMLHGLTAFNLDERSASARLERTHAGVRVTYLSPTTLRFRQWDGYDPEPQIKMPNQWHLEAGTTDVRQDMLMLTVLCPYRIDRRPSVAVERLESETAVGCAITSPGPKRLVVFRKPGLTGRAVVGTLAFDGAAAIADPRRKQVFQSEVDE
jgi:hypothetical protein